MLTAICALAPPTALLHVQAGAHSFLQQLVVLLVQLLSLPTALASLLAPLPVCLACPAPLVLVIFVPRDEVVVQVVLVWALCILL